MIWVAIACFAAGILLLLIAMVGVLRLPDFYSRMHMVGKADTLGSMLVLAGVIALEGANVTSVKLAMVVIFFFLANPASAHALGHAALRSGLPPWTRERS
jgi:multicomponent Na+:H+ antiporter subunit G